MRTTRTTRTANVELDPRGFVVARIHANAAQSLDDARENIGATIEVSAGTRRPLLVDISKCRPLEPDVRHYYSGRVLVESFTALGLLIEASPLGRMMGNVYLRIVRPGIPTRLFADEEAAFAWLIEVARG